MLTIDGTQYARTPDNAALDITGDIDLRAAVRLIDWTPSVEATLINKADAQLSYLFDVTTSGLLRFAWSSDGSSFNLVDSSTAPTVTDNTLLLVRVTGQVPTTVKFYTRTSTDANAFTDLDDDTIGVGAWVQLGVTQATASTPSIFSGNSTVRVGVNVHGDFLAAIIKNGVAGTAVANPDFYANVLPFTDGAGRPWGFVGGNMPLQYASEADEAFALTVSSVSDTVVDLGYATESDAARGLARAEEFGFETYPLYGALGCGSWTVQVARKGGSPVEVEVPASEVSMNRTEDDISTATVSFAQTDLPRWCVGALSDLRPWVHEATLLRDGEVVWVGPISSQIGWKRSSVRIQARDLFAWMERRVLPVSRNFQSVDQSLIFYQLVLDALSRDPSPNFAFDVDLAGVLASRTVSSADHLRAADVLRDIANVAVDWTMIGRTLRVRGQGRGTLLPNQLLDAHVLAEPELTEDGIQAASEWVVTGATGISATYGGVDPDAGLVTQVYADQDITTVSDAHDAAVALLNASGTEPLQVACDLAPEAPFSFNDLVPGDFIDTRLSFGAQGVAEPLMISSVSVTVQSAEKVSLVLVRPSTGAT